MEKSKYILSISSDKDYVNNQILRIIIQGNVKINYLGNTENINNNNIIEPLLFDRYNYGMKTAEMFEEYKELIKVLKEKCNVKMHKEARGFYIETLFTNEVRTLVLKEKIKIFLIL